MSFPIKETFLRTHYSSNSLSRAARITNMVKIEIDISLCLDLFTNKKTEIILSDEKLFWFLFLYVFSKTKDMNDDLVNVSLSGNNLIITGNQRIINSLKKNIKIFHQIFVKWFSQRKSFEIFLIKTGYGSFIADSKLDEKVDLYFFEENKYVSFDPAMFDTYIEPCFIQFLEALGVKYEKQVITKEICYHNKNYDTSSAQKEKTEGYRIIWNKEEFSYCIIDPITIAPDKEIQSILYDAYKNQAMSIITLKICGWDEKIKDEKSKEIKIYKELLVERGGDFFKNLLTKSFSEATSSEIVIKEVPIHLVEVYIDYLFKGPFMLTPKNIEEMYQEKKMDVIIDLYYLGQRFQNSSFINCIRNLINYFSKWSDIDTIEDLAQEFSDDYLHKLANALKKFHFEDTLEEKDKTLSPTDINIKV